MKNIRRRYAEICMLHVGLGSKFWHAEDIIFVLTGWVWK